MRDVELDIMSRPPEHNTTNLDLDRMNLMLDILGHPEQSFRVIHITGTNGKGCPMTISSTSGTRPRISWPWWTPRWRSKASRR